MYGKLVWSTNQQRNLNHIGSSFQIIPYWEGPDQWSNPDLNLLISNWKLKAKNGTVQELFHHILTNPATQCSHTRATSFANEKSGSTSFDKFDKFPCLYRETFLSVPLVWVNLPSAVILAVIESTPKWSTHSTKGIPPVRFTPSKKWAMEHYGSSGKATFLLHSVRTHLVNCAYRYGLVKQWHCGNSSPFSSFPNLLV